MSRGPGRVQRDILDELAPRGPWERDRPTRTIRQLAVRVYRDPTDSELQSVRRAVRQLVVRGLVVEVPTPAALARPGAERRYTSNEPLPKRRRLRLDDIDWNAELQNMTGK